MFSLLTERIWAYPPIWGCHFWSCLCCGCKGTPKATAALRRAPREVASRWLSESCFAKSSCNLGDGDSTTHPTSAPFLVFWLGGGVGRGVNAPKQPRFLETQTQGLQGSEWTRVPRIRSWTHHIRLQSAAFPAGICIGTYVQPCLMRVCLSCPPPPNNTCFGVPFGFSLNKKTPMCFKWVVFPLVLLQQPPNRS